jgi:hypothetical protein
LHHHAGRLSPALASLPSTRRHFAAATSTNPPPLSWDEFLRLRRQRRLAGLIASFPTAILGLCGGGLYFATQELDPTQTILGIDPYIMSVVFTAGCGLFGWLMGPTVGRGVWHLVHRKQAQLATEVYTHPFFFPSRSIATKADNTSARPNFSSIFRETERTLLFNLTAILFLTTMV